MKVTLIDFTPNAVDKLIYTKATRLTLGEDTRRKVTEMTEEEKLAELTYMAGTIPSSWEFITYTFEILGVSRAFTHQFVRTRTGSYAQQTMRMLNMEKFQYVTGPTIANNSSMQVIYDRCMREIQATYDELIEHGVAVEDARGVLPTNICTNIIAQFNLRNLAEMAKSRTGGRTQGEYRAVFEAMLACVVGVHPWVLHFLFPDTAKEFKKLESLLDKLLANSVIDAPERFNYLKALDMLKRRIA